MTYRYEGWGPNLSLEEVFRLPYGAFNFLYKHHAQVVEKRNEIQKKTAAIKGK